MTIQEFNQKITSMVSTRMSLETYPRYLQHKSREDKYLHEKYLAIQAVVRHKGYSDDIEIELGNEKEQWDARISGTDLFEVVQALPRDEHVIRKSVAGGKVEFFVPVDDPIEGESRSVPLDDRNARIMIQLNHSSNHLQYPGVIIDAIEKKHDKQYTDRRILVVVFDGDYSFERDDIIDGWLIEIRGRTNQGKFDEILLVELARQKVFVLFG